MGCDFVGGVAYTGLVTGSFTGSCAIPNEQLTVLTDTGKNSRMGL